MTFIVHGRAFNTTALNPPNLNGFGAAANSMIEDLNLRLRELTGLLHKEQATRELQLQRVTTLTAPPGGAEHFPQFTLTFRGSTSGVLVGELGVSSIFLETCGLKVTKLPHSTFFRAKDI
jgi:hypothetical protein